MTKKQCRQAGFTLIELMLVVLIIGVLAAIAVPRVARNPDRARTRAAVAEIESVTTMLDHFNIDVGRFPTTEEGLEALYRAPGGLENQDSWDGPYTRRRIIDPWGKENIYRCPPERGVDFDLISMGKDGLLGTDDDIANYDL